MSSPGACFRLFERLFKRREARLRLSADQEGVDCTLAPARLRGRASANVPDKGKQWAHPGHNILCELKFAAGAFTLPGKVFPSTFTSQNTCIEPQCTWRGVASGGKIHLHMWAPPTKRNRAQPPWRGAPGGWAPPEWLSPNRSTSNAQHPRGPGIPSAWPWVPGSCVGDPPG